MPDDETQSPPALLDPGDEGYTAFDPQSVEPPSSGPPATDASQADQEPHPGPDVAEPDLPEFDPRYRDEFEGLLFIGALKRTFTFLGHRFVIRTLTTDEVLAVGMAAKPYAGTMGEVKAYQAAVCAACVVSVDGQGLPIPITDDRGLVEDRFDYVRRHWFPPVLDVVYQEYLVLESKVEQVIEALGKPLGQA